MAVLAITQGSPVVILLVNDLMSFWQACFSIPEVTSIFWSVRYLSALPLCAGLGSVVP